MKKEQLKSQIILLKDLINNYESKKKWFFNDTHKTFKLTKKDQEKVKEVNKKSFENAIYSDRFHAYSIKTKQDINKDKALISLQYWKIKWYISIFGTNPILWENESYSYYILNNNWQNETRIASWIINDLNIIIWAIDWISYKEFNRKIRYFKNENKGYLNSITSFIKKNVMSLISAFFTAIIGIIVTILFYDHINNFLNIVFS